MITISEERKKLCITTGSTNVGFDLRSFFLASMAVSVFFALKIFFSFLPLYGWGVNTLRISIMISLGSREEVVFMLHVKRRDRGFTWSSFTLL